MCRSTLVTWKPSGAGPQSARSIAYETLTIGRLTSCSTIARRLRHALKGRVRDDRAVVVVHERIVQRVQVHDPGKKRGGAAGDERAHVEPRCRGRAHHPRVQWHGQRQAVVMYEEPVIRRLQVCHCTGTRAHPSRHAIFSRCLGVRGHPETRGTVSPAGLPDAAIRSPCARQMPVMIDSTRAAMGTGRRSAADGVEWRVFPNLSNRLAYHLQLFLPLGLGQYLRRHAGSFDVAHLHACRNMPGAHCRASSPPGRRAVRACAEWNGAAHRAPAAGQARLRCRGGTADPRRRVAGARRL